MASNSAAADTAADAASGASASSSFARPLPPAHPREEFLWRYFDRLRREDAASGRNLLAHLAVQRSENMGRCLLTDREYKKGAHTQAIRAAQRSDR
jgi:hypothetical protein